jgi:integrase
VTKVVPKRPRRKRTGTTQRFEAPDGSSFFRARIRLGDGSRPWYDVPKGYSEARAKEYAARLQELEDANGELLAAKVGTPAANESASGWFDRWHSWREGIGLRTVSTDRARVRDYVLPLLSSGSMAKVTRDELEDVRDALDAKIHKAAMSWKTAANTWGLVTKAFADAVDAKRRDLRVRRDNPVLGIKPPERGERKAKVYLYPAEAEELLACEEVPLRWRRFFALTIYLYARPGEVRALQWEDVDLERGVVHIHRSVDRETGTDK